MLTVPDDSDVQVCNARPCFQDGAKLHPYCGKTCARIANAPPTVTVANVAPNTSEGRSLDRVLCVLRTIVFL